MTRRRTWGLALLTSLALWTALYGIAHCVATATWNFVTLLAQAAA
ncbi:hypothetical protein [Micromonospora sp. WMMD980]|nr:hypothetical protein [Micromonospora sp. WMMD980]MDG4798953.1 hypothetical protein [Micromonospora sp. WMMD980]MDG4798974.1 hypothetical protein [Micromonospora sp. WMMD980]MDG4799019.1 hypothetical protein [Micromonospora sp. WMMD980]